MTEKNASKTKNEMKKLHKIQEKEKKKKSQQIVSLNN